MKSLAFFLASLVFLSSCVASKPSTLQVNYSGKTSSTEQHPPTNVYLLTAGEQPVSSYRKLGYLEISNVNELSKGIAYDLLMYEAWKRGGNAVLDAEHSQNKVTGWPIYMAIDSLTLQKYGPGHDIENVKIGVEWAHDIDHSKKQDYEDNRASNAVLNTLGVICLAGYYVYYNMED